MFKKPYNRSFDLPQNKLFCFSFVAAAFVCAVAGLIPKLQLFDSAVVQFLAGARNPFLNSLFLFLT